MTTPPSIAAAARRLQPADRCDPLLLLTPRRRRARSSRASALAWTRNRPTPDWNVQTDPLAPGDAEHRFPSTATRGRDPGGTPRPAPDGRDPAREDVLA